MNYIEKTISIYLNERPDTSKVCDIEFEYTTNQHYIDQCRVFVKVPLGWHLIEEFEGKNTIEKVKRYWGVDLYSLHLANKFLRRN